VIPAPTAEDNHSLLTMEGCGCYLCVGVSFVLFSALSLFFQVPGVKRSGKFGSIFKSYFRNSPEVQFWSKTYEKNHTNLQQTVDLNKNSLQVLTL
jgi:hypothetical protein